MRKTARPCLSGADDGQPDLENGIFRLGHEVGFDVRRVRVFIAGSAQPFQHRAALYFPEWPLASRPARRTPPNGRRARATAPCPPPPFPRRRRSCTASPHPSRGRRPAAPAAGRPACARASEGLLPAPRAPRGRERFGSSRRAFCRWARHIRDGKGVQRFHAVRKRRAAGRGQGKNGRACTPEASPRAPWKARRHERSERRG